MTPAEQLKELFLKHNRRRFPNLPEAARIIPKYSDSTVAGLTTMVFQWLVFHGHPAEKRTISDLNLKQEGSGYITSRIKEKYVVLELNITQDPLSGSQKLLKTKVETSDGVYFLAQNFSQFVEWYQQFSCK